MTQDSDFHDIDPLQNYVETIHRVSLIRVDLAVSNGRAKGCSTCRNWDNRRSLTREHGDASTMQRLLGTIDGQRE